MWLIEKTGEVRRVKFGEFYLNETERRGLDFVFWNVTDKTAGEYPILKVTEVEEYELSELDKSEKFRVFKPISPEPEIKRYEELGAFIHQHQILPDWSLGMAVEGFIETHKKFPESDIEGWDEW